MGYRSRGHVGEQVTPPGNRRAWPSGGHGLPVNGEVGIHAVAFRSAAQRDPEAADRFVEDEHRAPVLADAADGLEIAGLGGYHAGVEHDGFHDHRGDLAALVGHDALKRRGVVPLDGDDVAEGGRELAFAGRDGFRTLVPGVDVVNPAVIVAMEPQDESAAGRRPRHAQRGLHHLRAGTAEAHGLGPAEDGQHPFGGLDLLGMRRGEDDPAPLRGEDLVHDPRRRVAEEVGALAEQVVDVLGAVGVPDAAPRCPLHDQVRVEQPGVAAHAAGQRLPRAALPHVLPAGGAHGGH